MNLAAALVQIISLEAAQAAAQGRADKQRALDEKAVTMIRDYRKRFPTNLTFLQAECDLAARGGDLMRAIAITEEIDKISKSSTMGPMLRARSMPGRKKRARWPGLTASHWRGTHGSRMSACCWPRS